MASRCLESSSTGGWKRTKFLLLLEATGYVCIHFTIQLMSNSVLFQATIYKCNDDGSMKALQAYSDADVGVV